MCQSKYKFNLDKGEKLSTLLVNMLTLSGFLALIFGGMVTYTYLESIGQTAIFPDILSSPSALLALTLVFIVWALLFSSNLVMPYLIPQHLKKNDKIPLIREGWKNCYKPSYYSCLIINNIILFIVAIVSIIFGCALIKWVCVLLWFLFFYVFEYFEKIEYSKKADPKITCILIILIYMYIFIKYRIKKILIYTVLLFLLVIFFSELRLVILNNFFSEFTIVMTGIDWLGFIILNLLFIIDNTRNGIVSKQDELYSDVITSNLLFLISTLLFVIIIIQIIDAAYRENMAIWIFIVLSILWLLVYGINAYFAFCIYKNNQFSKIYLILPIFIFFIGLLGLIYLDSSKQLQRFILRPLHFIELSKDTNWYTIDTRFFAPNNLTIGELESNSNDLKQYFNYKAIQNIESQCQFLSNKTRKEQCEKKENQFKNERKYNRFYGYVAWNLGDMKVFCPHGYEQARLEAQKEKTSNPIQCLALKSEYIIPYY